ncbi:MAG TPA: DUF5691 domain-containing protein [Trebonia sp.]
MTDTLSFDDLVTAATIGVARKGLPTAALAGPAGSYPGAVDAGDPAAALLDAAALLTVSRRAGVQPVRGAACPPGAAAGAAPELPAPAARALRRIGGGHVAAGFAAAGSQLLADLLAAARDAGYVAPAALLPDLLDAAVRTAALRPVVAAVLGTRGRWLARHRADWRQVAELAPPDRTGASQPDGDDLQTWRTGSRGERRAYLARLRDRDPAGARELLATGWARETGEDRAALLTVLARGLSAGDEEFLEAALDDRAGTVRDLARRLLARLPGSAYRRRASQRAAAALRLESGGGSPRLVATLPGMPDDAAVRDGIDPRPPSPAIGARGWLLTELLAAAPLAHWTALCGLTPREIVALPVSPDRTTEVLAGWRLAAVRQRDGDWAQALLDAVDPEKAQNRPPAAWPPDQQLSAVLPAGVRAERIADVLLTGRDPGGGPMNVYAALAEVAGCPVPWPPVLAGAVVTVLRLATTRTTLTPLPRGLLDAAKRGLPATGDRDYAAELTRLADNYPQTWSPLLHSCAETIALRSIFLEEIR